MWNVKCSECGKEIEKESSEDVRRNIDDDPICGDCPYAEEPDYPVEDSITIRRDSINNKSLIKRTLPHLEEKQEEYGAQALPKELTSMLTRITIEFEIDKVETYNGEEYRVSITDAH